MTPRSPSSDTTDHCSANAVSLRDVFSFVITVKIAYFFYVFICEFVPAVSLTFKRTPFRAPFDVSVSIIIKNCTLEKMMGVYTGSIIAMMAYAQVKWVVIIVKKVRDAVCFVAVSFSTAKFKMPVAFTINCVFPNPAIFFTAHYKFGFKPYYVITRHRYVAHILTNMLSHIEKARRTCVRQVFGATLAAPLYFTPKERGVL